MDQQFKEQKRKALITWFGELIAQFREEYNALDDLERLQIPTSMNLVEPTQIEVFWLLNPIEYQHILFLHDASRPDKEIVINGPWKGDEFIARTTETMDEPRWKANVQKPEDSKKYELWNYTGKIKYSDFYAPHFSNLLNTVKMDIFAYQGGPGEQCSMPMGYGNWVRIFKGNIAEVKKPEDYVNDAINYAKTQSASIRQMREGGTPQPTPRVEEEELLPIIGAYYFPYVRIGENVDLPFRERVFGEGVHLPEIHFKFTIKGQLGFADTYGFFGIQTCDEKECLRLLNVLFGIFHIFGYEVQSVRQSELIRLDYNPKLGQLIGFAWRSGNTRRPSVLHPEESETRVINQNCLDNCINIANRVLGDEQLTEFALLLLESNTHLKDSEFSQSFLFSWLILEKYIAGAYISLLSEKKISGKRKKRLTTFEKWTTESKIEMLEITERIDSQQYEMFMKNNKLRNKFAHEGTSISESDADHLYAYALSLTEKVILDCCEESTVDD